MSLLDLIFPKYCVGCRKKGIYFCPDCTKAIKKNKQICPVCERASPFGQTHNFCLTRFALNGLFSLFVYDGIIRSAIHLLKYKYVTDIEEEFWHLIESEIRKRTGEMIVLNKYIIEEKPIIVPIPLYWYKENLRGFNQSLMISKRLSALCKIPISDKILIRRKSVSTQTKLTRTQREQNVKGIFSINPNYKLLITNCLLIDDVWTTGATMKEATRTLKEAGVKKVWGFTIAR